MPLRKKINIATSLYSSAMQSSFFKHYAMPSTNADAKAEQTMLKSVFLSLAKVVRRHFTHSTPQHLGQFLAAMHQITVELARFMLQSPGLGEVGRFISGNLKWHMVMRCSGMTAEQVDFLKLNDMMLQSILREDYEVALFRRTRDSLIPVVTVSKQEKLLLMARQLADYMLHAMLDINEAFHRHWSFSQFRSFTHAFGKELREGLITDQERIQFRRNYRGRQSDRVDPWSLHDLRYGPLIIDRTFDLEIQAELPARVPPQEGEVEDEDDH